MYGLRTVIHDVHDLDAAKRFYAWFLGKDPYFDQPFYVGFDADGYELGLRPAEGESRAGAGGTTAYLAVHDVDAELARVVERGARVREQPVDVGDGIRVASFVDPFGNVLGLIRNLAFAPKLVEAAAGDLSEREICHECTIAASRKDLWPLWTTTEGLTKWLCDEANVELRVGGPFEVHFLRDEAYGSRGSETCRVLSFLPERMLSFTWNAPPHLATRNLHTWVVVTFEDVHEHTRVTIVHTGWPASGLRDDPEWEQTFEYFEGAWPSVLDSLHTYAETHMRRPPPG